MLGDALRISTCRESPFSLVVCTSDMLPSSSTSTLNPLLLFPDGGERRSIRKNKNNSCCSLRCGRMVSSTLEITRKVRDSNGVESDFAS